MKQKQDIDHLFELLQTHGYIISSYQKEQAFKFLELLNKSMIRQNLVSRGDQDLLVKKHFVDSCVYCNVIKSFQLSKDDGLSVIDVGVGAGFPGVLISAFLKIRVVLLDSNRKKTLFLRKVARELCLDVDIVNERAEVFAKHTNTQFDVVTARAVTALPELVEMARPLLNDGGLLVTLKGDDYNDEIAPPFVASMFSVASPKRYLSKYSNHLNAKKIIIYRNTNESGI